MTRPQGPAIRGSRRSCGSRSGLTTVLRRDPVDRAHRSASRSRGDAGREVGQVQPQHRPAVVGEHAGVAGGLGRDQRPNVNVLAGHVEVLGRVGR